MFALRLTNSIAEMSRHPMYLVSWSRPVMFGIKRKHAVVSSGSEPLTWVTRNAAERNLLEISTDNKKWIFEIVELNTTPGKE